MYVYMCYGHGHDVFRCVVDVSMHLDMLLYVCVSGCMYQTRVEESKRIKCPIDVCGWV